MDQLRGPVAVVASPKLLVMRPGNVRAGLEARWIVQTSSHSGGGA